MKIQLFFLFDFFEDALAGDDVDNFESDAFVVPFTWAFSRN